MKRKAPQQDIERDNRNTLQAAAYEIGCSKRTLQRWMHQTYTARTTKEGREIQCPRVLVNEYQSAKQRRWILRAVFDENGKKIWSAHRKKPPTPEQIARWAERERIEIKHLRKLFGYF